MRSSRYITFSGNQKVKKDIKVKGYVRKGKFVRSFNREQNVNQIALKVAGVSLAVLGGALGIGITGAAVTKFRYNKNLVDFGKKIANGTADIPSMKIPEGVKKIKPPYRIDADKDDLTFFIGGMGRAEDALGEKLMKTVRASFKARGKDITKRHELVPLFHNYQVKRDVNLKVLGKDLSDTPVAKMGQEIYDVFNKAAIKGYNEDSLIMANEIYKWHKLNPTKPINLITASGGGFQGKDVPHLLNAAGVDPKLMKVFSTATPDYGIVDEIVPTLKVMHTDDMYARTIPKIKQLNLPSLHRGTTWVGPGDTPEYRAMLKKGNKMVSDYEMPAAVHFAPAYFNGETLSSKKTLKLLENFMFND